MELPPHLREPEIVPRSGSGRSFTTTRRVRWGDGDHTGRLRLDGVARYLQDLSNDDTRDIGHDAAAPWIVRRTTIAVHRSVRVGETVTGTTFAGGLGRSWAERRTTLSTERGGLIEAASLWIFVDPVTHRPTRLTPEVIDVYAEAAAGRKVPARLRHPEPHRPVGEAGDEPAVVETIRPWPLRSTDLDGLGHVNNAATWEAVEDELARRELVAVVAELEYRDGIRPDDEVQLRSTSQPLTVESPASHADASAPTPDGGVGTGAGSDRPADQLGEDRFVSLWLVVEGEVRASAQVHARKRRT